MVVYVQKVSCRVAECSAITNLSDFARLASKPFFILRPSASDKKSYREKIEEQLQRLMISVGEQPLFGIPAREIYLDTSWIFSISENENAFLYTCDLAKKIYRLNITPVIPFRELDFLSQHTRHFIEKEFNGICIIYDRANDHPEKMNSLSQILSGFDISVDFNLELGLIQRRNLTLFEEAAKRVLDIAENAGISGNIILSGASFPGQIGKLTTRHGRALLPRYEYQLFQKLRNSKAIPARTIFSDYTTVFPSFTPAKIPNNLHNAYLKYTGPDSWMTLRGTNLEEHGYDQIYSLSQILISQNPNYRGHNYSYGDRIIYEWAHKQRPPGRPPLWNEVAANQHMEFLTHQLSG